MAAIGHSITVLDQSNKVVSTSKHLINVFKEAKAAYRERKAEIVAGRQYELEEKRARRALKASASHHDTSSRASERTSKTKPSRPRLAPHHYHSESVISDEIRSPPPTSPLRQHDGRTSNPPSPRALTRRHTDRDTAPKSPSIFQPTTSTCTIDMDLAYGDVPPPLEVTRIKGPRKQGQDDTRGGRMSSNPDAMAAVALTLAEISNIASKMAPGALMTLKGSAPAVFALLASPQFMIAAGVGIGITVVALGGYKVIKKIKAKHADESPGMDKMLEIGEIHMLGMV
ncbi:MAG: hypothetical protein Q9203_003867 [Teloschistes exilis]